MRADAYSTMYEKKDSKKKCSRRIRLILEKSEFKYDVESSFVRKLSIV